jgi:molecular chaperone GrpE
MADEATQGRAPVGPRDEVSGSDATETAGHEQLEALRQEAAEHWNKYLRICAELDNVRKRNAREVEHARRFGAERLAQAILPVRDSLEAGLVAGDGVEVATLLEGTRATLRLLDDALRSAGLTEIDPLGEPFDPARHEAMTVRPTDEVEPDTVVDVIQKGYEIHERVIRPARVIVSQAARAE